VLAPAVVSLALWVGALGHVNVASLGEYGLPPALPVAWYLALATLIGTALVLMLRSPARPMLAIAYVALVALVLFGTVPALSGQPHYAWVYKHLGVVRYLELTGHTHASVDIYNRWPGFFALAAGISTLAGRANPEPYAGWADLFFMWADLLLVVVATRAIVRDQRIAVAGGLLFVLTNWVGQTYYSPQAFAYALWLALLTILLTQLGTGREAPASRASSAVRRLARRAQLAPIAAQGEWPRPAAIAIVIAIDAVIVASHQLTPYVVLVSTALLMILGSVRPRWPLLVMGAMTFGYLALNLRFIEHNYGLLSSVDPFNNVQGPKIGGSPSPGKVFNTDVELIFIAVVWLCTIASVAALFRRGLGLRALPLLALAVSPVAIVFGQNYGGEASLRIVLFSSPWCSALIAWGILTSPRWRARATLCATALGFTALFTVSYLGLEELNIVSAAEVRASEHFYSHARHGSVLVLAAPGFPYRYGASYPDYGGPEGDANPNLMTEAAFVGHPLGAAQVRAIAGRIRVYSRNGYIAFSRDETAYADVFRLTPPGALDRLRAAVAASPLFRLWYANADVQIYELVMAESRVRTAPPRVRARQPGATDPMPGKAGRENPRRSRGVGGRGGRPARGSVSDGAHPH
jgi:hypothetical protein